MALLEFKNLTKKFENITVLDNVNLNIESGKIFCVLGQNGAGKTTLIKLINSLLTPSSGEILFKGEKIGINSKNLISYLPERTYLDKSMNAEQVFRFFGGEKIFFVYLHGGCFWEGWRKVLWGCE